MFPLGELTKQQVRAEAARRGFAVAAKPDSYDICFIPDGDTHGYLVDKLGARTGSVVDSESGEVLAEHDGVLRLHHRPAQGAEVAATRGGRPAALRAGHRAGHRHGDGRPGQPDWMSGMITADRVVFSRGEPPQFPLRTVAQLRAHGGTVRGSADLVDGRIRLTLDEPVRAVAPGQTVVLYDAGDRVRASVPAPSCGRPDDRDQGQAGNARRRRSSRRWSSCSRSSGPGTCTAATGVGSLPGTSPTEAAAMVAGELPALPHVVELPDRGVGADMVGRAVAMLVDIYGEVVPSGWRISRRPGRDAGRAQDFLSWDLDAVQQQYAGAEWVKVQVCGPWTLAAMLEVPSGHRALTDAGAVDDLATSLAEGLAAHIAEIGKRVPGAGRRGADR